MFARLGDVYSGGLFSPARRDCLVGLVAPSLHSAFDGGIPRSEASFRFRGTRREVGEGVAEQTSPARDGGGGLDGVCDDLDGVGELGREEELGRRGHRGERRAGKRRAFRQPRACIHPGPRALCVSLFGLFPIRYSTPVVIATAITTILCLDCPESAPRLAFRGTYASSRDRSRRLGTERFLSQRSHTRSDRRTNPSDMPFLRRRGLRPSSVAAWEHLLTASRVKGNP